MKQKSQTNCFVKCWNWWIPLFWWHTALPISGWRQSSVRSDGRKDTFLFECLQRTRKQNSVKKKFAIVTLFTAHRQTNDNATISHSIPNSNSNECKTMWNLIWMKKSQHRCWSSCTVNVVAFRRFALIAVSTILITSRE